MNIDVYDKLSLLFWMKTLLGLQYDFDELLLSILLVSQDREYLRYK